MLISLMLILFFREYEAELKQDFQGRFPEQVYKNEVAFTILLGFIRDRRGYFEATIPNSDLWLLNNIFGDMEVPLIGEKVDVRTYDFYVQRQIMVICDWAKYENFSKQKIPAYVKKLVRTRLVNPLEVKNF